MCATRDIECISSSVRSTQSPLCERQSRFAYLATQDAVACYMSDVCLLVITEEASLICLVG